MDMNNGFVGQQFGDSTFAAKSGVPSQWYNRAFACPSTTEQDVDAVIKYMDGVPFGWRVLSNQNDIKDLLEGKGLVCSGQGYIMQKSFESGEQTEQINPHDSSDDHIKVVQAINPPGWNLWNTIAAKGADLPEEDVRNFSTYILNNANDYLVSWYLGYVNDNPVITSVLIKHIPSRKATIHLVIAIDDQPDRAVYNALINHMVKDASMDQCWPILIFASPTSRTWVQALGFKDVETYSIYTQKASTNAVQP